MLHENNYDRRGRAVSKVGRLRLELGSMIHTEDFVMLGPVEHFAKAGSDKGKHSEKDASARQLSEHDRALLSRLFARAILRSWIFFSTDHTRSHAPI
jgi:hypothetical protein